MFEKILNVSDWAIAIWSPICFVLAFFNDSINWYEVGFWLLVFSSTSSRLLQRHNEKK